MKAKNPLHLREAWVIFFVLGLVMLNFPFLHIFNKDIQIFGIPLIVLYLMVGWPLSIAIIYLFSLLLDTGEADDGEPPAAPPQDQA
ncbi:MAG: hypothetical protein FDZ69_02125 [Deltaproteobacteria bacterium]|nr:MAG: hypothetical protein FDZ69_02125 [Deltaproteobacteria bacterium]